MCIRDSLEVQKHYLRMIADGQEPRFAEMCALQQPPGTKGMDRTFMEGRMDGSWLDKLPKKQAMRMLREAKADGISTAGKYYMSGLADARGHRDPEAWVDSVDDIRRVARNRNLQVQGVVNIESTPVPPKRVPINPKIVRKLSSQLMAQDKKLSRQEASRIVRERHTPHWAKKSE